MAHLPNTALPNVRPTASGKWLRCPQCSNAYWGAFRPTDFILAKLGAHIERKHRVEGTGEGAADAAPAQVVQPKAQRPAPRARNAARIAKIAARAQARGDGEVRIVRPAGPQTRDLQVLEQGVQDLLADIQNELDPRLQGGQGPRMFAQSGGNQRRVAAGRKRGWRINTNVRNLLNGQVAV